MDAAGRQLSIDEALALCAAAGFRHDQLVKAVSVMSAESGRRVGAIGINASVNADGSITKSIDRGVFQINSIHSDLSNEDALKPLPNARKAKEIHLIAGWDAWSAFKNNSWKLFADEVRARLATGEYAFIVPYVDAF